MVEAAREHQRKRFESTDIAFDAYKQMALTGILASWADALRFDHFSASNGLTPKPVDWNHNFNRTL